MRWWLGAGLAVVAWSSLRFAGLDTLALVCKPVPVGLLAVLVFLHGRAPGARWLALALAVDAVADGVIEVVFLWGLAIFLVGHLARIVSFTLDRPGWAPARALPFLAIVLGVGAVVVPTAGPLGPPIALYAATIGTMGWRAAARAGSSPDAWIGLAGALLFLLSDTLIAVNRFLVPLPAATVWVMSTYWGAQALLARSALGDGWEASTPRA
ncbi:MAG: lysoplasmalogenase [Alphaproteobacteria bacterium]|nr:lysoplasmalogenase [Alphaproteobacteria bacterium]MCB9696667.1 lysoplasmalogenase [Alphaproteobacteria bacterium]